MGRAHPPIKFLVQLIFEVFEDAQILAAWRCLRHSCHVREREEVVGPQDGANLKLWQVRDSPVQCSQDRGLPTWLVEVVVSKPTPREASWQNDDTPCESHGLQFKALDFLLKLEVFLQILRAYACATSCQAWCLQQRRRLRSKSW